MRPTLALVDGPLVEPVDLESARLHLRVDSITDDELIEELITAAREHVEEITWRKLLTQTWDYRLSAWPSENAIVLPFGNLQSVTSVKWKDDEGTETTLTATTDYLVETNGTDCGRIVLPADVTWPNELLYPSNPITIRFVCGWTSEAAVPYSLKAAIKLLVAKLYESRGEDTLGQTVHEDAAATALMQPYRLWQFA